MTSTTALLRELLDLDDVGARTTEDVYVGHTPSLGPRRVFGGQVLAQSIVAGARTVEADRPIHSLHGYFLRPGDPNTPITYGVSRLRDRLTGLITGKPRAAEPLGEALQTGAAALVTAQAQTAADMTIRSWRATPGGRALAEAHPELGKLDREDDKAIERMIRDWQHEIFEMVKSEGKDRRTSARASNSNGRTVASGYAS